LTIHGITLFLSGIWSILFGFIFLLYTPLFITFPLVPFYLKIFPLLLCFVILLYLLRFKSFPIIRSVFLNYYFSRILFLSKLLLTFFSNYYFFSVSFCSKTTEIGMFNYVLNVASRHLVKNFSKAVRKISYLKPLVIILLFIFFLFLL